MEERSAKKAMLKSLNYLVEEIARFRRMVELQPELHEMSVEEFDALLNEMCEAAHRKFAEKDFGDMAMDALMRMARMANDGSEKAATSLADFFKGMGDE